jgi:hypothetical protein
MNLELNASLFSGQMKIEYITFAFFICKGGIRDTRRWLSKETKVVGQGRALGHVLRAGGLGSIQENSCAIYG